MKKGILFLLLASPILLFSQDKYYYPKKDSIDRFRYYYEDVINTPSVTESELFSRAKNFVANTVKNSDNIIREDKESGVIVIKGMEEFSSSTTQKKQRYNRTTFAIYQLKIQVRENKYKFTFDYPEIKQSSFSSFSAGLNDTDFMMFVSNRDTKETDVNSILWRDEFATLNLSSNAIIEKLIKAMQIPSKDDF